MRRFSQATLRADMDIDAFVAAHRAEWDRLDALTRRGRRLRGAEVDELVDLYQRAATHLSTVRSSAPDPALVGRLSVLVSRAHGVVTGGQTTATRELVLFVTTRFPAAVYRARWWWIGVAAIFVLVSGAFAWWVAVSPDVQASIAPPESIRQLVDHDFQDYYSSHPAADFAVQVWTNNAWITALSIASGALLGLPIPYLLLTNSLNVGVSAGLMAANGKLGLFFGLILPHGLLELTAVFIASGVGLRLGWSAIAPGARTRSDAMAQEGRAAVGVAMGLVVVLLVSGVLEAFVTPSGLPTWARVGVGATVLALFLVYVFVLGRRAVRAGETGDIDRTLVGDSLPVAA
jgi:uncharacterized membrane protein SpoIIM required for sporulation